VREETPTLLGPLERANLNPEAVLQVTHANNPNTGDEIFTLTYVRRMEANPGLQSARELYRLSDRRLSAKLAAPV
jgi:hypothetical protein